MAYPAAPDRGGDTRADRLVRVLSQLSGPLAAQRGSTRPFVPPVSSTRLAETLARLRPLLSAARLGRGSDDLWAIVGLGDNEVRNSRILAWLFDPFGSHGAEDAFLQALWSRIRGEEKLGFRLESITRVRRENYPMGNASNRIDIEVAGADFVLFIEVKIYAGETKAGQLSQYIELAETKRQNLRKSHCGVLLLSRQKMPDMPWLLQTTWSELGDVILDTLAQRPLDPFSARLVTLFAQHIKAFEGR